MPDLNALSTIIIIVLFFLSAESLTAQDTPSATSEPITLEGRQALQFGVGSNLTLTSVDNYLFSYKWMTGTNKGFRLNLNVSLDLLSDDRDTYRELESGPQIIDRNDSRTFFTADFGAEIDFLRYHRIHEKLFLYSSIGPIFQYRYDSRVTTHFEESFVDNELFNTQELRVVTKINQFGIGGSAGIGIEWFVTSYISFAGEYALRLIANYRVANSRRQTTGTVTEENVDDKLINVSLDGTGARIRLSVYF